MGKQYTIQEVLEFPVGTIFLDKQRDEIQVSNDGGKCKVLTGLFLGNKDKRLVISSLWINEKFTLKKIPLTFFEAIERANNGSVITSIRGWKYKKANGKLVGQYNDSDYGVVEIKCSEISGEWYEVLE